MIDPKIFKDADNVLLKKIEVSSDDGPEKLGEQCFSQMDCDSGLYELMTKVCDKADIDQFVYRNSLLQGYFQIVEKDQKLLLLAASAFNYGRAALIQLGSAYKNLKTRCESLETALAYMEKENGKKD